MTVKSIANINRGKFKEMIEQAMRRRAHGTATREDDAVLWAGGCIDHLAADLSRRDKLAGH